MENQNCEMLFEYLKSILYDSQTEELDIAQLEEPYQKLGRGLQYLQHAVKEMQDYTAELSKGNLSCEYPSRENFLCSNLKNLHANLNHLTWQAKQTAAGDYSQHVSYLGEFSEAFNTMTMQLKEREALLKEEAEKMKQRAEVIESYNELLVEMTRKRNEWILVVNAQTREIMYCNKQKDDKKTDYGFCDVCKDRLEFRDRIINWQDSEKFKVWETGDEESGFFRITTFQIEWRGCNANAHIVMDVTQEKAEADKLASKAYFDSGTGIRNRLYFEEYMERILTGNICGTLCYMDLDGLKHVNDKFGHSEGDVYIRSFVLLIKNGFRGTDVFARIGGDEFAVFLPNCQSAFVKEKMENLREEFIRENDRKYPRSFSYGIVEMDGKDTVWCLEEMLRQADAEMYRYKRLNKERQP